MLKLSQITLTLIAAATLAACGGGSSTASNPLPQPQLSTPTVTFKGDSISANPVNISRGQTATVQLGINEIFTVTSSDSNIGSSSLQTITGTCVFSALNLSSTTYKGSFGSACVKKLVLTVGSDVTTFNITVQ